MSNIIRIYISIWSVLIKIMKSSTQGSLVRIDRFFLLPRQVVIAWSKK